MSISLLDSGIGTVGEALRTQQITAVELTRQLLARIDERDTTLHAYITIDHEGALKAARDADQEISNGDWRGPLHGIPIAIKDNIPTASVRTTYNSRAYADHRPEHDAAVVSRLIDAGAVIIGKTNLNEFGWSVPSDHDLVAPPRNPWNTGYLAVGSSSGSGAAVAAGLAFAALGTDGGGSTRLPAGQMGLVGLKPTAGTLPGPGRLVDRISVVGVLARNAADASTVFDALQGQPPSPLPKVSSMKLAVPHKLIAALQVEDEVAAAFERDLRLLADLGFDLTDVDLPLFTRARDANFVMIKALAHTDHLEDLRRHGDLIGATTRRYLSQGADISAADFLRAEVSAQEFAAELDEALSDRAGLVTPVSTVVTAEAARRPGEHESGRNASFTAPFNAIGWPAVAIPSGRGSLGIPLGLQVGARPGTERMLLAIAAAVGAANGQQDAVAV